MTGIGAATAGIERSRTMREKGAESRENRENMGR